jgi:hypothetical protein
MSFTDCKGNVRPECVELQDLPLQKGIFGKKQAEGQWPDYILDELRPAIRVPPEFWDYANARPRWPTPAATDYSHLLPDEVRDQGRQRRTCVAFAIAAAMELRFLREGRRLRLSPQYANWVFQKERNRIYQEEGSELISLAEGLDILSRHGICEEEYSSYEENAADPADCAQKNARFGIRNYFLIDRLLPQIPSTRMTPRLDGPGVSNTAYLECMLARNHEVLIAISMSSTLCVHVASGTWNINCMGGSEHFCIPPLPSASHALLMIGYTRIADVPHFICRNSLRGVDSGPGCGLALLSYDYVRTYAQYGAVITGVSDRMKS